MGTIQKAINTAIGTASVVKGAKESQKKSINSEIAGTEKSLGALSEQIGTREKEIIRTQASLDATTVERKGIYRNKQDIVSNQGKAAYSDALKKISIQRKALRDSLLVANEQKALKLEQRSLLENRLKQLKGE